MKPVLKYSFATALLFSNLTYAMNPVQGLYLGFILGGNYASKVDLGYPYTNDILIPYNTPGTLTYDFGGNIGGQLGYKINHFRVEGEFNYAYLGYDKLQFNGITITKKRTTTAVKLGGNTKVMSAFLNAYYDLFTADADTTFTPYVGLGIGMANLRSITDLTLNGLVLVKQNYSQSSGAVQGILGVNYYLDDFTTVSLDYRYMTTNNLKVSDFIDQRFTVSSFNLGFNFVLAS